LCSKEDLSEWDKLWVLEDEVLELDFRPWLRKVKTEGDKLQRTIATGYCGECDIHKEKLGAIRKMVYDCYDSGIPKFSETLVIRLMGVLDS